MLIYKKQIRLNYDRYQIFISLSDWRLYDTANESVANHEDILDDLHAFIKSKWKEVGGPVRYGSDSTAIGVFIENCKAEWLYKMMDHSIRQQTLPLRVSY